MLSPVPFNATLIEHKAQPLPQPRQQRGAHAPPADGSHQTQQIFVDGRTLQQQVNLQADNGPVVAEAWAAINSARADAQMARDEAAQVTHAAQLHVCLLYTSPSPRD